MGVSIVKITERMKKKMLFSFEVFPPKKDKGIESLLATLDRLYSLNPDSVSCTYGAGGTDVGRNREILKAIVQSGETIPLTHYTCIGKTKEEITKDLEDYLEMGVQNILALRGDYPQGWENTGGDFEHANELVEFVKGNYPEFCIAVAGNPEKHLEAATFKEDISHLRRKQDSGADLIMTQVCYDIEQFERWLKQIRKAGITIPVSAGIMPVLSKDFILQMTLSNGASIPKELAEIIGKYGDDPDEFKKAGKEYTVELIHDYMNLGVDGLQIYSLNNWKDTNDILEAAGISGIK